MRKISNKGTYSSLLDRFQNDEVVHASQLQQNWTKEWCEYLDHIRTIGISHNGALQNNWNDTLHCIIFGTIQNMEKGLMKSRPDYHETTRVIGSMNKEASQNTKSMRRNNYREDLDPEKLDWLVWLSHNWKWHFAVHRH